ncbi:MAG: TIM barrel protein [Anaerolineae bacterium]
MRLGAPVGSTASPEQWAAEVQRLGYRAAYCPINSDADAQTIAAYVRAAQEADIVIAEVGAWHNNPISPDDAVRAAAIKNCQEKLAFADEVGALCCVNVAGSRGERWDGPHEDNLTAETFDLIVETTRAIIDAVKPKRTYYSLEPMPWVFPDSPDSYLELMKAIDREGFAVHLDPVNMISSPRLFFNNAAFLKECFDKLGAYIKSCHAKDTVIGGKLTTHLDEVRPGLGKLDYKVFLQQMQRLDKDAPFMLEHLPAEEYLPAAQYVRDTAQSIGITL